MSRREEGGNLSHGINFTGGRTTSSQCKTDLRLTELQITQSRSSDRKVQKRKDVITHSVCKKKFCSDIITSTIQTYSNQTKSNQVSMRTVCVVLYIYIRVCVCSPWSQNVQTLFLFEVHHFFLRRPGQWSSKKITCPSLASLIDISELLLHKIRTLCCHEM